MRILIAEDDFASRKFMLRFLSQYGECDVTVDGMEAVDAFLMALEDEENYDLVCLDIMMPELDGYQALKAMRDIEKEKGYIVAQIKEDPKNAKKPENIIEKMVEGKIGKFFEQNCLLQQPFVKDDKVKVGDYLASNGVKLLQYVRFEKGEGLEKKEDNFAEEVASMTK